MKLQLFFLYIAFQISLTCLIITSVRSSNFTQSINNISREEHSFRDDNACPYHPETQAFSDEEYKNIITPLLNSISDYIESQVSEVNRPAISANIVYQNKIIWQGNFGQTSKNVSTKPNGNTVYRIGSISKLFPTIFLFKLWENGNLNLDDPVRKYAPNFKIKNPFQFSGHLTLLDIASQISGIPSFFPFDLLKQDYFEWNGTLEQTLTKLKDEILVINPRTTCYYSNMAYSLLASILARNFTEDGNFESWAQKYIVNNLHLSNTGFTLTDDLKSRLAIGYYPTGQEAPQIDLKWFRPAGNYYSSANDIARLSMNFLGTSDQTILRRETILKMLKIQLKCGFGYLSQFTGSPWEINERHSYLVVQKDGDIDGYSASLAMVPDLQLSFTILMSGSRPPSRPIVPNIMNKIIPVFVDVLRKKNQTVLPATSPSQYVGLYQIDEIQSWNVTASRDNVLTMSNPATPGSPLQIGLSFVSDGILKLTLLGGEFPCVIGSSNLDVQNGALLQFRNLTEGKFNQFDMPALNLYGFQRVY